MSEQLTVSEAPASYQAMPDSLRVRPGYKQAEVGVIPEDWEVVPTVLLGIDLPVTPLACSAASHQAALFFSGIIIVPCWAAAICSPIIEAV